MSDPIEYGEYLIWYTPAPINSRNMDWSFARKDFTSEHDGDPHAGHEASEEECRRSIDFIEDMEAEDATPEGRARNEASAKRLTERAMEMLACMNMARALNQILQIPGIGNLPGFATGTHLQMARNALDSYLQYHPDLATRKEDPTP